MHDMLSTVSTKQFVSTKRAELRLRSRLLVLPVRRISDLLFDFATGELSHVQIVGSIISHAEQECEGQFAEALKAEREFYRPMTGGENESNTTARLYGASIRAARCSPIRPAYRVAPPIWERSASRPLTQHSTVRCPRVATREMPTGAGVPRIDRASEIAASSARHKAAIDQPA